MPLFPTGPSSPEDLLRPYLEAALSLATPSSPSETAPAPLFTVFYTHNPSSSADSTSVPSPTGVIVTPPAIQLLPVIADEATENAEAMFWKAVEQLKAAGVRRSIIKESFAKVKEGGEEAAEAEEPQEVDSFWPPLDASWARCFVVRDLPSE